MHKFLFCNKIYYMSVQVSSTVVLIIIPRGHISTFIRDLLWKPGLYYFDILLTVHLSIILVINQLNAQILVL